MPTWISQDTDFQAYINAIPTGRPIAIDTEFEWTRTYFPRLALLQLATGEDNCALVDPFAITDWTPLRTLLTDPERPKIVFSGRNDLPILTRVCGGYANCCPSSVYDIQLAMGFAGHAANASLKDTIEKLFGIVMDKSETRSDWTRRPLSPQQLDYAADAPAIRGIYAGQGHSVDGAWARGQGWAIYGFTMMYRFTRDPAFLSRARRTADWWIAHTRAAAVPAWDFAVPDGPHDASAAAVVASALVELDGYAPGCGYRAAAERLVAALSSDAFFAAPGAAGGFLLLHSTGNAPAGHEIDVPLAYADYYYLEALTRLNK